MEDKQMGKEKIQIVPTMIIPTYYFKGHVFYSDDGEEVFDTIQPCFIPSGELHIDIYYYEDEIDVGPGGGVRVD